MANKNGKELCEPHDLVAPYIGSMIKQTMRLNSVVVMVLLEMQGLGGGAGSPIAHDAGSSNNWANDDHGLVILLVFDWVPDTQDMAEVQLPR